MLTEIKTFTLILTYCNVLYDLKIINMAAFQLTRSDFYHSTALKFASAFNINKHGNCPFFIYTFRYGYYFITKFHSIYFMVLFSCEAVMNRKSSSHFSIFLFSYQGFSNFFSMKIFMNIVSYNVTEEILKFNTVHGFYKKKYF